MLIQICSGFCCRKLAGQETEPRDGEGVPAKEGKDVDDIAIWKAAAEHGLTRTITSPSGTIIDVTSANFLFKRLIAHEYVESKLMQNGYIFNGLEGRSTINSVNFGAHELSINAGSPLGEYPQWTSLLKIKKEPSEFGGDYTKLDIIVGEILNILE